MASILIDCFEERYLDRIIRERAVATTLVDVVTLLGRRADAATIAAEGGAAALGLALVVLEDEEAVIARLELGAIEGLIRRCVTPAGGVARLQADAVEGTHNLVGVARPAAVRQRVGRKALRLLEILKITTLLLVFETLLQIEVLEVVATDILTRLESIQVCHAERTDIHH